MNIRWVRWALWRRIFEILPRHRELSFPMKSIPAVAIAEKVFEDRLRFENVSFDPDNHAEILKRAEWHDKILGENSQRASLFRRQVAIVPDCAVLGHVGSVVAADGSMLSAYPSELPNWNQARPRRLNSRMFRHGLVTWLEGTHHYFHFFASLLPLLAYLEREHRPDRPLTVLIPANGPRYVRDVCMAVEVAYRGVRFEGLAGDERAEVASYLWLHHGSDNLERLPVDVALGGKLADLVRHHYRQETPRGGQYLFLSRGDAKLRRIVNEEELEAIAARHGFERFVAHADNHEEQVRRFSEADVIVAAHGAGLTNLLFARPGATVLEIFPEDFVKSTYLWLALRKGLNYRALVGEIGDYRQAFRVPGDKFAASLEDAMAASELAAEPWKIVGMPLPRAASGAAAR